MDAINRVPTFFVGPFEECLRIVHATPILQACEQEKDLYDTAILYYTGAIWELQTCEQVDWSLRRSSFGGSLDGATVANPRAGETGLCQYSMAGSLRQGFV
jgi:hypothetical protein